MIDKTIGVAELASWLDIKPDTLRKWRANGQGPKSFKLGGKIVYLMDDVNAWFDSQKEKAK